MYKSYGTRKNVRSRLARKHLRREVFMFNKKMVKARRKAARMERQGTAQEKQGE